ncbi:hypothetical protein [Bacillus alkalicellulosilyticus]|uniref:hypothetical protein n=1 Tax=Alkalihalobacterium alkalicellulosilyticum TaxID=1912214 RepID=UPI000995E5FA|nr:hypothetical protein [Bacillus alkalicellulosilyticus]
MKKTIKVSVFFSFILLFGILFGIYQATDGELGATATQISEETKPESNIVATEKPKKEKAKEENNQEDGSTNKELMEKQKRVEEVKPFNFYSELGAKMGKGLEIIFHQVVTTIITTIHSFLNG